MGSGGARTLWSPGNGAGAADLDRWSNLDHTLAPLAPVREPTPVRELVARAVQIDGEGMLCLAECLDDNRPSIMPRAAVAAQD